MADFYRELISYRDLLEKKITTAATFLRCAPDGYLECNLQKGNVRYSQKLNSNENGRKRTYISSADAGLAQSLAQKRYYERLLPVMEKEKRMLDKVVAELEDGKKERCYSEINEYRKCLVKPEFCLPEDHEEKWSKVEFNHKQMNPDVKTVKTRNGENVRSKSEKIIADELFYREIPYRYEAGISLQGIVIYPDFTVLNKRTGKEYYLEHLGMMDNADYYGGVIRRLDLYAQNGIFVGDRLLLTYETSHYAINTAQLNHIIEEYLM